MGDSNREEPPSEGPSFGDLLKSDEFQNKLEAARARRAEIQAERAKSGRPHKLRPIRPGEGPPAKDDAPIMLGTSERVSERSAKVVPLTPGMRIAGEVDHAASVPAPDRSEEPRRPARRTEAAPLAAPVRAPRKTPSSIGRTLLTSVAGIVIGFAAGAIVMDLAGREIAFPLPAMLETGPREVGAIRPTRDFQMMVDPPAMPDPAATGGPGRLAAASPSLDVPEAPPNGTGAERPDFSTDPPAAPFAEQAAGSSVVLFAGGDAALEDLTRRLASLGVSNVEARSVTIGLMDGTAIRFYREEDASLARGLATVLDATVQDLTSFRPRPEEARIEIWVGGT